MVTPSSKRELKSMYKRLGTITAVAEELGVAYETARQRLLAAGVLLKPKGRPSPGTPTLDSSTLVEQYAAGESTQALGERFGVSSATVRARLIEAGVQLRPRRGWKY